MQKRLLILLLSILALVFLLKANGFLPKLPKLPAFHLQSSEELEEQPKISNAQVFTEPVLQQPELPTGCESVALTMALNVYDCELDKTTIARDWLIRNDENYVTGYVGDPFTDQGAGIFPPGLCETANNYLKNSGRGQRAYDVTGMELSELLDYIASGLPVVVWVTVDYETPRYSGSLIEYNGKTYRWFSNEHCVMLGGFNRNDGTVMIYDPKQGQITKDMEQFQSLYDEIGRYALLIV